MQTQQTPLGSGFGAQTTADEVLADTNLTGKLAIVTGGHSGLGLATTRALSKAGAQVVVASRDSEKAQETVGNMAGVEVEAMNLADLDSVREFTERFIASGRIADIVINNAGIMACPETRLGPGWEAQFATNHLGHFTLINCLWPALKAGSRVVAVSSSGHHQSGMRWDDIQFSTGYDKWLAYGQSKTANALFAFHLDQLGKEHGVRAFSLHPGKIFTPLQRHLKKEEMVKAGWMNADGNPADPTFKSPEQGSATQVWAATSPQLAEAGGVYCEDCDIAPIDRSEKPTFSGVREYAIDPSQAARLWDLSAHLTGANAFKPS